MSDRSADEEADGANRVGDESGGEILSGEPQRQIEPFLDDIDETLFE